MAFYPEGIQAQSPKGCEERATQLPWVGGVGSANPNGVMARPAGRWP